MFTTINRIFIIGLAKTTAKIMKIFIHHTVIAKRTLILLRLCMGPPKSPAPLKFWTPLISGLLETHTFQFKLHNIEYTGVSCSPLLLIISLLLKSFGGFLVCYFSLCCPFLLSLHA